MDYLLKTDIPLSDFLCDSCSTTKADEHHDNNAAAYIRYEVPVDVDSKQLTVSLDVKKITWHQVSPGAYLAYSEMYVDCPLCNFRHNILSKVEAPKIFLESSMNCDVCHSNLNLIDENISLEDEGGRERLTIKGTLICNSCGKNASLEYSQDADDILSDDITLLSLHSKRSDLRIRGIESMRFKIGVTFTGTHRSRVNSIVNALQNLGLSKEDIFYDDWHDVLINGIDADIELQNIYTNHCDCVVVFLAKDYNTRPWTRGVEWRAIRKIINTINGKKICLLNVDGVDINEIDGLSSFTDIAKKIESLSAEEVAEFIRRRYELVIANSTVEGKERTTSNDSINVVEELKMRPSNEKNQGEKYSINIHGGNVQINPDAQNTTITQINHPPSFSMKELLSLIENVKIMAPPTLNTDEVEIIQDSLTIIETETISSSPKKPLLRNATNALKTIKGTAEFGAAVVALVQFVQTFLIK